MRERERELLPRRVLLLRRGFFRFQVETDRKKKRKEEGRKERKRGREGIDTNRY